MSDSTTNLTQLRAMVAEFVAERDWQQFHSPKNLSMALAIEVAELMEHFQWLTPVESRRLKEDSQSMQPVQEEIADVLCYTIALANELEIDLSDALRKKMVKNRLKYPAEEYQGRYQKTDDADESQ